jgi:hypothetical protein
LCALNLNATPFHIAGADETPGPSLAAAFLSVYCLATPAQHSAIIIIIISRDNNNSNGSDNNNKCDQPPSESSQSHYSALSFSLAVAFDGREKTSTGHKIVF